MKSGKTLIILLIIALVTGCGASNHQSVTPVTLVSIAVTPATPSIAIGVSQQFTATGTFSDGSTRNITTSVTWSSSAATAAAITSGGKALALAAGTTTITATYGGISGTSILTVTSVTLVSIAVTPVTPSIAIGAIKQFTATGTFSDKSTQDITASVTWNSSSPAIATITSAGLATGVAPGTVSITATSGTVVAYTTLTVTSVTLVSIAFNQTTTSIAGGTTDQFKAIGTFSDKSTQDITASVTWNSSSPAIAAITSAGLATGVAPGTVSITATSGTVIAYTTLTVTSGTLVSIAITPTVPSIAAGTTQQFTAIGTYSDGSTQDLTTTVTWSSSAAAVATITSGKVTAVAAGITTIEASSGKIFVSTNLTVTPATLVSIAFTQAAPSIAGGTTDQLTAIGTFSDKSTQDITASVTWNSSSPAIATITSAGLATGVAPGTVSITATSGTVIAYTTLTVTSATLVSIEITPTTTPTGYVGTTEAFSMTTGAVQQFTAIGTFSDNSNQDITALVTWSSSSSSAPTVATITSGGKVTAGTNTGLSTIEASLGKIYVYMTLTVGSTSNSLATLTSIAITPNIISIAYPGTQQYTAIGTFSDRPNEDITTLVTWSSSAPTSVDTITPGGLLITGQGAGTTTIEATSGNIFGYTTLTVN